MLDADDGIGSDLGSHFNSDQLNSVTSKLKVRS